MQNKNPSKPLYGLIPAAGKGVRARPYTHEQHKGMLTIDGMPNIQRIIMLMRNELHIQDIVIVTGYLGQSIRDFFGDGSAFGVYISYIENNDLDKGWAWSVYLAKSIIDDYFCIMLCDESYIHSNHHLINQIDFKNYIAICAGIPVDSAAMIKKNYSVEFDGKRVIALKEKPEMIVNDIMGTGTFICSPEIFESLEKSFGAQKHIDFVSFLNGLCEQGKSLGFFELQGTYVNINDRDSLHLARYHDRIANFDQYTISLLICSEGDEEEIGFTINRYRELNLFNQIAVVLPSSNKIHNLVTHAGAEVILCPPDVQGFGARIHHGISRLNTDIFILTEADYSFPNRDVIKLLSYLKESDLVTGTRTTRQLIEQGSNMRGAVRLAHTFLGFILECLWWTKEGRFTDTGCTFRALWRTTWQQLEADANSEGPEFLADMVISSLNRRLRVLEIPVNYFNCSQSQNRNYRNFSTFFRLLFFMLKKRLVPRRRP